MTEKIPNTPNVEQVKRWVEPAAQVLGLAQWGHLSITDTEGIEGDFLKLLPSTDDNEIRFVIFSLSLSVSIHRLMSSIQFSKAVKALDCSALESGLKEM